MYCVKSSWAGQTFALATINDSGPKKSRIRRSKEERKTMVQSFIKRYQSLNDGKFPSLNLTHKEVGGSFYTVREIVREIIQENRVLGPGQITPEEYKEDVIAMNYPIGTISSEPQGPLFKTVSDVNGISTQEVKETTVLCLDGDGKHTEHIDVGIVQYRTEHHASVIGEEDADEHLSLPKSETLCSSEQERESFKLNLSLNSDGKCLDVDGTNDAHVVNHIDTNYISDNSKELLVEGLQGETVEVDGESEQIGALQAKTTLVTEEVEVETFPLRPAVKKSDGIESSEVSVLGGSPDMIIKDAEFNHVMVQNWEVNQENSPVKDDIDIHNRMSHISAHRDSTVEQNNLQPRNASSGTTYSKNSDGTSCKNAKEVTVLNGIAFNKHGKAAVGSSPLNRIDLESWRTSKQEMNPLLAFFKAFIDAFSRLWSE